MKTKTKKTECGDCRVPMEARREVVNYPVARGWSIKLAGTLVHTCPKCGEKEIHISKISALSRTIAGEVVKKPGPLSGAELSYLRDCLELTGRKFAEWIGVSAETLSRYETDREEIPTTKDRLVRLLVLNLYLRVLGETFPTIVEHTSTGSRAPLKLTVHADKSGTWRRAA